MEQMKVFDTGASRSGGDKLDYAKALSVQVLERYLQYLKAHRTMPDGSKRDFDNWKRGIPTRDYVSSLVRHTVDTERKYLGLPVPENATLEDLCCAVIFNASGLLFELLVEKSGNRELEGPKKTPTPEVKFKCGECRRFYKNGGYCSVNTSKNRPRLHSDTGDVDCFYALTCGECANNGLCKLMATGVPTKCTLFCRMTH